MPSKNAPTALEDLRKKSPEKFPSSETAFSRIHSGDHILIGSGCGEPQYLLKSFISYVRANPKAILDAEVFQLWALGNVPYGDERLAENLRHNSFFIGCEVREAVNKGLADYTPISLSDVPDLFFRGIVPVDVALIQVSPPDVEGFMSLGVSVDIVKSAVKQASLVIVQVNCNMPRVSGDGRLHADDVDYILPCDEPLIEYRPEVDEETAGKIGNYLSRLVHDGETIQAGYGGLVSSAVAHLKDKKHLGVHTELLSGGLVSLLRSGAVDNSSKTVNPWKTVASFCMGTQEDYRFLDGNTGIEFRGIEYTNDPLVIAGHENMTAINSALGIDLTGQATEESVGKSFYGGIGGQANYMRGAVLSRNGKSILVLESTAEGGKVSRIMPFLEEGAGVTLNRGDVHYVVTEYGIAYLHGKNIRERAMELISIAHPRFRPHLLAIAKKNNIVYPDQALISGKNGTYPEGLEAYRTTRTGLGILLRPVKITDEHLLKDFFYSLSEESLYHRFISVRKDMPHHRLQDYTVIDYEKRMIILAVSPDEKDEELIGVGQYDILEDSHTAEIAFVVRDKYQNKGVGKELLKYLTYIAKKKGLLGFKAAVLPDNKAMTTLFEEAGFEADKKTADGLYEYRSIFRRRQ